jgi:UDP-N-acetylmuramyl tripeptide synthase
MVCALLLCPQKLLGGMRDRGATAAVLELTSEALGMGATRYTDIDLAIWSNHGDDPEAVLLHGSPEAYLEANLSLLEQLREPERQRVVVNLDDAAAPQVRGGERYSKPASDSWTGVRSVCAPQ